MKYFKTQTATQAGGYSQSYEISVESFDKYTHKNKPFFKKISHEKFSAYAICPKCENPIQLVGIFSNGSKRDPYGKHTGKNISGLPEWNQLRYEVCPYAKPGTRIKPSKEADFFTVDERVFSIYNLLQKEFDTVTYFMEQKLQIKLSVKAWEDALARFVGSGAYGYKWLTEANLPYIFAYWGIHQQEIYNQYFIVGTDLYETLKKRPEISFAEVKTGNKDIDQYMKKYRRLTKAGKEFVDLSIGLYGHNYLTSNENGLDEYMQFCILDGNNNEIYKEKIVFDQTYFQELIQLDRSQRASRPELLRFAMENMPSLEIEGKNNNSI